MLLSGALTARRLRSAACRAARREAARRQGVMSGEMSDGAATRVAGRAGVAGGALGRGGRRLRR